MVLTIRIFMNYEEFQVSKTKSIAMTMLLFAVPLALQGCVTNQDMEAMRSDINRLQIQIAGYQDNLGKLNQELQTNIVEHNQQLRAQNRDMQARIEDLAAVEEVIKKNQADINAKIDSMTSSLAALGGQSEEGQASAMGLGAKLDSLNATLSQRLDGMDRSINQLGTSVSSMETQVANLTATDRKPEGKAVEAGDTSSAGSETAAEGETGPAGDPMEIYQNAYADYTKGNFDLAITGFEGFLKDFPDASLAPNAQYWMGECYYSKREFKKAIEDFDKVIKDYPGTMKVPSAYLKKGFALDELGDKAAAKAQYRKIVDAYPLAPEAAIAKEKLKEKK